MIEDCNVDYPHVHCPHCEAAVRIPTDITQLPDKCPSCGGSCRVKVDSLNDLIALIMGDLGMGDVDPADVTIIEGGRFGPPSDPGMN